MRSRRQAPRAGHQSSKVNGHEVLKAIKSDEALRSIPVVMLTTSADNAEVVATYRAAANSDLTKPVKFGLYRDNAYCQDNELSWFVVRVGARGLGLGDGHQPIGLSPEALRQGIATLREEAQAVGRDVASIPVSIALSMATARAGRHTLGTNEREIAVNAEAFSALPGYE